MQFSDLHLSTPILRALTQEGYTIPTPIQAQAIPHIMAGRDMLGIAQTGTGKTAAFALPLLHRLMTAPVDKTQRGPQKPRVLVLSPTRELAVQIGESFDNYGRETGISNVCIFGGVSEFHQKRALKHGVDIIIATPGRLMDLMEQRAADLSSIQAFVLDEADRMLDMGFIQPIRRIAAATPAGRQTLLFSATMPKEIIHLAHSLLRDPVKVAVTPVASAAPKIEQSLYMVRRELKQPLLRLLLESPEMSRTLVFTKTKHGAERVSKKLSRSGIAADAIHGDKAQNYRLRALARFKNGSARVLVATDVAARGLDVDDITHVINFDLPMEPEAYIHRIGRTGRAGATGIAISFCDGEERGLLRDIERLTGKKLPIVQTPEVQPEAPSADDRPRREQHARQPHARGGAPDRSHHRGSDHAPARGRAPKAAYGSAPAEHRETRGEHAPRSKPAAKPHEAKHAPRPEGKHEPRAAHAAKPAHGSAHAPASSKGPKPAPWSKYVKKRTGR